MKKTTDSKVSQLFHFFGFKCCKPEAEPEISQEPIITSEIIPLESTELYLKSQKILDNSNELNLIGPIDYSNLKSALQNNDIFNITLPTLILLNVKNHWISCLIISTDQSAHCYLINSYQDESYDNRSNFLYKEVIKIFASAYNTVKAKQPSFPLFKAEIVYTGHQSDLEICGYCTLLYLERLLNALKNNNVIKSVEDLTKILVRNSDGESLLTRQNYICNVIPLSQLEALPELK